MVGMTIWITMPRRIFKGGGNVPGFQQRIIGQDFLTAGAGGQQIEQILDADAKTPQVRPPPALGWIDGDTVGFAHLHLPRQKR